MLRKAFFAIALVATLSTSAFAATTISGGEHFTTPNTLFTFPIVATSDNNDQIGGVDLLLGIADAAGPLITNVTLIDGTVFETNNTGMTFFEGYTAPARETAYFITTAAGTVPVGTVAWVTIDTTGVAPGQYALSLSLDVGDSAALLPGGIPGAYTNGVINVVGVPEPGSMVLGLFAAAGLGAVVIRRRRRNA